MKTPTFDETAWQLLGHQKEWVLLGSKANRKQARVMRYDDLGDLEFYEKGDVQEMTGLFNQLTGSTLEAPERPRGIGLDTFDNLYPQSAWEGIDSFKNNVEIEYLLWRQKRVRGINPPAMVSSAFRDPHGEICWEVIDEGGLREVRERFNRMKAMSGYKPAPEPEPVNPYANHPNFGRF